MTRLAGRNGRIYANITSGGTAEPISFQTTWTLSASTDKHDVTAFGDTTKVFVGGLPDATGTFAGFYDDATPQLYTAALDGVARKMYLYPSVLLVTQYFWGTALFDFNIDIPVSGPASVSGSWAAATPVIKQG